MTDEEIKAQAEAEEKAKAERVRAGVTIENGKVILNEKDYNNLVGIKNDLDTAKERARKSEALAEQLTKAKLESEEKALLEKQEYKTLYEKEKAEKENMNTKLRDGQITSALSVAALEAGIAKGDYVRLIDKSKVNINPDTGEITGVKEIVDKFKAENPELFKTAIDNTHIENGTGHKATGVMSDDDVKKMTAKEIMAAKKDNPALYKRWTLLSALGRQ